MCERCGQAKATVSVGPERDPERWHLCKSCAATYGSVGPNDGSDPADDIARAFHDRYEALAPSFGYETRQESAVAWGGVPEANKKLMRAVVAALLDDGIIEIPRVRGALVREPILMAHRPADVETGDRL